MNEAQVIAVTSRVPNVLVSAGAGSGKTRVLTTRYFHLVTDDALSVDEILTLTFTRKAAQEMRERIARQLEAEGRVFERRKLTRAPIGTIHAFCERVLREHALQAGIDPNFSVLDDPESRTLQEESLDTLFEHVWDEAQHQGDREDLARLLLDFPHGELRNALLEIFRQARSQGTAIEDLTLPTLAAPTGAAALRDAVEALLDLPGTTGWEEAKAGVRAAYAELQPLMAPGPFSWERYDRVGALSSALRPRGGPTRPAKEARDAIKTALCHWRQEMLDEAAHPYLAALLTLLLRFSTTYQQAKEAQGLLDFEDLLILTRNLLATPDTAAARRLSSQFRQIMVDEFQDTNPLQFGIIRALQGANGHLFMVGDVKQAIYRFRGGDVGVFLGQEQGVLAQEDSGQGQRVAMHTNYRTRPEVLDPINAIFARLWGYEAREDGFRFEDLAAGQRFVEKTIPAVEMAFWMGGEGSAPELRDREAAWIARRILQFTGALGDEALAVTGRDAEGNPLPRPARFGDVILLFRASGEIARYENALREAGVPYYVVSGRGFYQSREVQDLVHLLRVLENPMDDFSLAVVLRSPLVGVSDDTLYWLSRDWTGWTAEAPLPADIRAQPRYGRLWAGIARAHELPSLSTADREALLTFRGLVGELQAAMTAGQPLDLIDLILARTGYATVLLAGEGGEQRAANVQKLREVAAAYQARGIFDLSAFQRYLTQLTAVAPREASAPLNVEGSDVVRLMTVHAAKGLEAPIVFLADCGRTPKAQNNHLLLGADATLHCCVRTPEDAWEKTANFKAAAAASARAESEEAERLLYVALTRAQEHLICSGFRGNKKSDDSYTGLLIRTLGIEPSADEDQDLALPFADTAYPVRIWSAASLAATAALAPPPQPSTLWEAHAPTILAGGDLPVLADAAQVERFSRVLDRMQPLPPARRDGPLRVGVHRILCYHACPRQFWLRYVLHREGALARTALPPVMEQVAEQVDDERARVDGTEFGRLLHLVMQGIDFAEPLVPQLGPLLDALPDPVEEAERTALARCLERFAAGPLLPKLQRCGTIHRELRFLVREGGVYVPGIIDVLAEEDGAWWVLDYKTGRPSANHLRQVALYALGAQHTLGAAPARVVVAYLDGEGTLREEPVTPALLDGSRQLIREAGEGIRQEIFSPQTGRHCAYCPYQDACAEGRMAGAGVA